ncbi:metallophosphoesterase [Thermoactinospora rubra]|uniref:metallophosphoesterase n=1 Tax=Thermoactinospora rubra TaxID=1088767 RepID=UPI000A106931|nr:metallophosphoesterase [Thermoactinospora rubra]
MAIIAHISDIHIGGSEQSVERARRVMERLRPLPGPLDAIIVTGDIADHSEPEEYEIARDLLRADVPVAVCPGNHDYHPEIFQKVLGPLNQALHLDGVTIALADSSIPGRNEGFLADATVAWLDEVLSRRPDVPALVGMHHPPIKLGFPLVDSIMLQETGRLAAVLERHRNVAGVLVGHAHTPATGTFAGRPVVVAPGVVSTGLTAAETASGMPLDYGLPPAYALHYFDEGRLVTHFRPVL